MPRCIHEYAGEKSLARRVGFAIVAAIMMAQLCLSCESTAQDRLESPVYELKLTGPQSLVDLDGNVATVDVSHRWNANPHSLEFRDDADQRSAATIHSSISDADLPSREITIAAWVRIDCENPWAGILSAVQDNGTYERGFVLGTNGTGTRFTFGLVSEETQRITYLDSQDHIRLSQWSHVVAVYSGESQLLYVDGRLSAGSTTQHGAIVYPDQGLVTLGAYHDQSEVHNLRGAISSLAIYDNALEHDDVRQLYESQSEQFNTGTPNEQVPSSVVNASPSFEQWNAYRGNNGRTAYIDKELPSSLEIVWHWSTAPPNPSLATPGVKKLLAKPRQDRATNRG